MSEIIWILPKLIFLQLKENLSKKSEKSAFIFNVYFFLNILIFPVTSNTLLKSFT